jgi:hypothetical protein
MSQYAASARIVRATPHLARSRREQESDDGPVAAAASVVEMGPSSPSSGALVARAAERWTAARERWSQLTFYLLDPQSWR